MNWIAEVLEEHLRENPEHKFLFDERTPDGITFKEIYDLSGKVYAYLKAKNIGKENFVLINLERGVKPFIALIGVWRCGAAFVMTENTDPNDRIKYIYDNCNCKLEINETVWGDILKTKPLNGFEEVDDHDAAYAVYTSGTTGNPKGIIHEYGNLKETCDSAYYNCEPIFAKNEKFAFIASLNFAVTIILFLPIFNLKQSQFHVCSQYISKNFKNLKSYLLEKQITAMFLPPSYIRTIGEANFSFLKKILVASEPANSITPPEGVLIYNAYSMSESVFWSCIFKIDKKYDICPIGQPQFNKKVYLLDEKGNEVADGEVGEFCFDNPYVRGYIGLPEENERAFQNEICHSNDLAKRLQNGDYVIIGRKNDMVKINGNRVEPAEVEAVIRNVLNIDWCGVRGFEEDENAYLAAYYTADIPPIDIKELREKLSKKLPYYMLPAHFIKIDKIPVNRNGKFDRKSLPLPELKAEEIILPETDFEKQMFATVSNILQIKDFGVTTNLISMGLTSIKAIKLSAIINKETNYSIKTGDILAKPYIREWINFADKETEKIEVLEKKDTYPLTPNQLGIYIDWERNKDGLQYNLPMLLKLNHIEPEKLLDSLNKVIELHPYFKVHIIQDENSEIVQERRDEEQLSVVFEKLDTEPDNKFFQQRVKPFNLLKDDLSRFEIYYTDNNIYLFMDIYHILFDGTSANILVSDILKSCEEKEINQEQATAYDYSLYLKDWKQSENYKLSENYFEKLISDTESFMYPSANSNAQQTGKSEIYVGKVTKKGIKDYCSKLGITENAFFAVVLTQVFHRISREDNIQISTISSGRSLEQLSNTIGMFVQTLPLVSKNSKGNISEILTSMQKQIISTLNNDKYPYTELVEKYNVKPNILYAYQGDVIDINNSSNLKRISLETDTVITPLSINIIPENNTYSLSFEYDTGLYTHDEIEKLSLSVSNFASNLIKQSTDTKIENISLVSEKEEQDLIKLGTGEKLEYDKTKTFIDLFFEQVKLNSDNIAVVDYKSSITYEELDKQSDILANVLIKKGVKPNDFVAIKLPRIKEFLVSVIGIWKSGAAYVPIDLNYPQDRINYTIEDSGVKVIIDEEFLASIDFNQETKSINQTTPNNLAYMIYTSGSTGKPKGVMISQESLAAFHAWKKELFNATSNDTFAHYISFSFDASLEDFIAPISTGCTIHILGEEIRRNLEKLKDYIITNNITILTLPTQLGREFINNYADLPIRYLTIGGEKLTGLKETSFNVINGYGPTEFTVCSDYHIIDVEKDKDNIPIGRPVPNSISAIVDENGNLLPKGVLGELVLIGSQISKGYWNRPKLTNEKFVDCPFLQGKKMYKTGDLVSWNENNELMFIGRIDNQVKLRGFRIELGEIESVLSKIDGIKSCVVEVKTINDTQHLVAYYVSDNKLNSEILKHELSKLLTEYMVPDVFIHLDKMPLTPNGKVNRKALPIPELKAEEIVLPETEFEKVIFDIVSKELKIKDFGVTTNLISMGLTSIKAIKLSAIIKKETNYSIKTGDILAKPYIREWIDFADKETEKIEILPKQKTYPLTPNQLGIYIDWEGNRDGLQYNIPTALKLNNIDPEKLFNALNTTIEAHPYFKVHIKRDENGEIVQEQNENLYLPVLLKELNTEPTKEFFQSRVKPFDILKDNLSRFEIYYTNKTTYLFCDRHHILFDGASAGIFLSELFKAYNGEKIDKETANAYDYSLFYKHWEQSKNYEKSERYFSELISDTESFMYPSTNSNAQATSKREVYYGKINKKEIQDFCSKLGITENAFFATVLTQVFHRISREDNIQISTISSGRSLEQLSNTIGMFVKTLPLVANEFKGDISYILKSMQQQIISTINNDKYPYTKLVEKYGIKPNVLYAYQGDVIEKDSRFEQIQLDLNTVKTPISINVIPENDNYNLIFEYDNGLYTKEEIERLSLSISNFASNLIKQTADTKIENISLVSEKEQQELITLGTGEKLEYDKTKTFIDLFFEQVKLNSDNIAIVDYRSSITYAELDRQTNILANILTEKGVQPNDFVAVKLPRIKEFLVSVIGIWKSGAAYVPIDLKYPQDRINYMIEDSEAKVVIDEEFLANIDFNAEVESTNLTTPNNLAYMIYTSGSTGKPKGVMITQESLVAFCTWKKELLKVTSDDTFAHYISFSFDASLEDFATSISSGSTIYILSEETRTNIDKLRDYIITNNITILALPVQLGKEFINNYDNLPIRYLTLGGEKITGLKETSFNVINGYGPTEFTVCSDYHIIDVEKDRDNIPIGSPVPNSISAIVDENGNLLPKGMKGELVLIGAQISKGYWNRPKLTKEKFVDCPFIQDQKMYKTGDLVCWNENNELIFIGRIDNQVKLRGFRIELGEIESVLSKIDGIKSCVVEVKTINDTQHLVAYYISDNELNPDNLKQELSKSLTEYMIPDIFIRLDKMPLTPNGKVNRKSLPVSEIENIFEEFVEPQSKTEKIICKIYGNILNIDNYSAMGNFFKLGGTSITAIRAIGELQKYNFDVIYGDIFRYKTPRELADYLDNSRDEQEINAFDFGDYDYAKINSVLEKTRADLSEDIETHPLGDILLTGATGFLGIYILKYLLETTESKISLLIRPKGNISPENRILTTYFYYFDEKLTETYKNRITIIEGDITDKNLHSKLSNYHYDTVFNCAALVKHFIADDMLDKINVEGVRNLIECCSIDNATLIHISTSSVAAISEQNSNQIFDEQKLYVGQVSSNDYIRTKFLAERYLLEAIASGKLNGKIMRLGNLMGRKSDGEFQMNFNTNAFVNLLKSYAILGVYPQSQLNMPIEMSPIDQVAQAIVKLAGTPSDMLIFHPYNEHNICISTILDEINNIGYPINYVEESIFAAKVKEFRNAPKLVKYLQGILHYTTHKADNKVITKVDNNLTTSVLNKLGFSWSKPDKQYLDNFLQLLDKMNFFHL